MYADVPATPMQFNFQATCGVTHDSALAHGGAEPGWQLLALHRRASTCTCACWLRTLAMRQRSAFAPAMRLFHLAPWLRHGAHASETEEIWVAPVPEAQSNRCSCVLRLEAGPGSWPHALDTLTRRPETWSDPGNACPGLPAPPDAMCAVPGGTPCTPDRMAPW